MINKNLTVEEWLNNNELGINIWKNKYCHNNETLEQWFDRVSNGDEKIKQLIKEKKFLFGGRILSNRGLSNDEKVTYSNCYVITPPNDSIESIYESRKRLARTFSYGGGCGIDISNLAPAGARVRNQAKATSGAVSFMQGYSNTTEEIGQNGRRGALMISIDCTHPDLEEFIDIKTKDNSVTKANISVKVNDDFMKAVQNDADWELSYTRKETNETIKKTVKARKIFEKLCKNNWDWAEPGILYWDRINSWNLLSNNPEFHYAGVNPCAEEPLPAGGSCLLGSLNLSAFVKEPFTDNAYFDDEDFAKSVGIATVALNEVLDEGLKLHPLKEQRKAVSDWRQIGLGIMGLADTFIKLGYKYGDSDSLRLLDYIGQILINCAAFASSELASIQGTYPKYNNLVLESDFFKENMTEELTEKIKKHGLRNSQLLTCAPTGSTATMLNVSNGIEPIFAKGWTRKTESLHGKDTYYIEHPQVINDLLKAKNLTEIPDYVVTAMELEPETRVNIQSVLQRYIDASISSTVNLANEATVEDIGKIYMLAWERGLKGITIYRDGCAKGGILTTDTPKQEKETNPEVEEENLKRGEIISIADLDAIGFKRKLMTGCGSLHCTAYFDINSGDLVEVYLSKGSTGGCNNFMVGLSRMISMAARAGVNIYDIIDQLNSTGSCPSYAVRSATKHDTSKGSCCPMAVGNALKDMYEEFNGINRTSHKKEVPKPKKKIEEKVEKNVARCPVCGEPLSQEGGCNLCRSCGWSKCD